MGRAKQIPTRKIATKCQANPLIPNLLDSVAIQAVHAVAVNIRSQLKPEMTHVANGAAQNSGQAFGPDLVKWIPKQIIGRINPAADRMP